jgi:hypothetical protein
VEFEVLSRLGFCGILGCPDEVSVEFEVCPDEVSVEFEVCPDEVSVEF